MSIAGTRYVRLGIAALIGLALALSLTHHLLFDIARVRTELYLAFITLLAATAFLVDKGLGRLLPRLALLPVTAKAGLILGPLLFAGVLVLFRSSAPGSMDVTDGNNNTQLEPAAMESWGTRRSGFEMHPVVANAESPSRIRIRLPGRLRWAGGKLRVYATQPDWAVFDPQGRIYEGTDGVDLAFYADGPQGLVPLRVFTLDLHHDATQRLWQEVDIHAPAATNNLVIDALQKENNWYDRIWLSVEAQEGNADGVLAAADWLSLAAVLSLITSALAALWRMTTAGSLIEASGRVLKTPFHSEFLLFKERSESFEKLAGELQKERDDLRKQVAGVEAERHRLKRLTETLHAELERYKQAEKEAVALKLRPESWLDIPKIARVHDSARIRPGTFALLHHTGDGSGFGAVVDRAADFEFTHKGVYDPAIDQILLTGGSPNSAHNTLVRYDVREARWSVEPVTGQWAAGPAYDTAAINPAGREFYASSRLRSNSLRCMNLDTKAWSALAHQPDSIGFVPSEPSAEYFPDRDELVWLQKQRVGAWKKSTNTWAVVSLVAEGLGVRGAIARYCPSERCIFILGGATTDTVPATVSHAVYKYDERGNLTRMRDTPPSVAIYPNRAVAVIDPVTGNLMILQAVLGRDITDFTGAVEFWEYNAAGDAWTPLDVSLVPPPSGWWRENHPAGVLAVPLSKYGVVMFLSLSGARSSVFLFKR